MDYETVSGRAFGRAMTGVSVNLLTQDVRREAAFLQKVFGCDLPRLTDDYAIVLHGTVAMQLHSDASFAAHALHSLLPESGPRGLGIEIRLHGCDPDLACSRAENHAGMVLAPARDKEGHGLREAMILSPSGYAFVPSVLL